ncbi:hypothetical protein [Pseudomonas sp. PH1b]|uniref:hypothetical protein n=1 Tax=Pseudomonas sp. PH1b TaxID=1397282 RepID=UPI000468345B|nr:hypothetical protein [Pseudomonas sp. PH1b]
MLISSASPQELVDWFHTRQEPLTQQPLLCVLLAPRNADQKKLTKLIADLDDVDRAMGSKVGFILLDPKATTTLAIDRSGGEVAAFPGQVLSSAQHPGDDIRALRDEQAFQDLGQNWEKVQQRIARDTSKATARFVPEFLELFEISPEDQPCLCVLVKGLDESVVLPLGRDWSAEQLISLLEKLRVIANQLPDFHSAFQSVKTAGPEHLLPALKKATKEIDEHILTLESVLEKIHSRYAGTADDHTTLATFHADRYPGTAQLQRVFSQLSYSSVAAFQDDLQVKRAGKLMSQIGEIRNKIHRNDQQCRQVALSIADKAQLIVESRTQMLDALSRLQAGASRVVSTSTLNRQALGNLKSGLEWIDLGGNAQEKLTRAVGWCVKLIETY